MAQTGSPQDPHCSVCFVFSKEAGGKDIDALFGKSKYFEAKHNYSGALESVNQIIVQYNSFIPGLIEKMRMQLCLQDWEATLETSQRYSMAVLQI